jgi:glucose/arabinose dehydrogenase
MRNVLVLSLFAAVLGAAAAHAAGEDAGGPLLRGQQAFGGWQADKPGVRRLIAPADLPAPFATLSASNSPGVVRRPAGAKLHTMPGFQVAPFATGLDKPRVITIAPNGDVFVADSGAGRIMVYRPGPDGRVARHAVFAAGLSRPYGIAFYPPGPQPAYVYVGEPGRVVRFAYTDGAMTAAGKADTIVAHILASHHWTRDVAFSPAGKNKRILATGLRNCSGMTVQPATGQLWCVVNERDGLGDNLPAEYATHVAPGAFYGWPWYYIGAHPDPNHKGARPDLAAKVMVPDVLFQAHSAPLGIAFYTGSAFPADFRGDAFVAMHGSWNRGARTGYKVVRLPFKDGKPTGVYQDFLTGFVAKGGAVWGRPVDVAMAHDGSLLVSDDGSGTVWRVSAARKE